MNTEKLFSFREESGRARIYILLSECLKAVYTALTTGVFLTGFLLSAGMNDVNITVVTSLPLISGLLYPFSPLLLERFRKRKSLLGVFRFFFHTFSFLAVTILPGICQGNTLRRMMIFAVFLGNASNILVASGFPSWHISFLPEEIRGRFFAISGIVNSVCTALAALAASVLADFAASSGKQMYWMGIIRMGAYVLALAELILLLLPKEPEYSVSAVKGKALLRKPLQNQKFMGTMIPVFVWMMISTMTLYSANTYLLNDVGAEYTFISVLQACNIVTTTVSMPFWHRLLLRTSWLRAFQKVFVLFALYPFLHLLVTGRTYYVLLPVTMIVYQIVMAGGTLYFNNMAYLFTPEESRTVYLSYYLMIAALGSLCGQGISAFLLKWLEQGKNMGMLAPAQWIFVLQGTFSLLFAWWFHRKLIYKLERV